MAYALTTSLALGTAKTGLASTLRAQLYDVSNVAVGSIISTGFAERGAGNYQWYYNSFPDGFRGLVHFTDTGDATINEVLAINPQEAEYMNAKLTTTVPTAGAIRAEMDSNSTALAAITSYVDSLETRLTSQRGVNLDSIPTIASTLTDLAARLSSAWAARLDTTISSRLASADYSDYSGDGDTAVDHDTGGADALKIVDSNGAAVDGATIRAYLTSEYTTNRTTATIRGVARTGSDGRWTEPMMLNSGIAYTLVITTSNGDKLAATHAITV